MPLMGRNITNTTLPNQLYEVILSDKCNLANFHGVCEGLLVGRMPAKKPIFSVQRTHQALTEENFSNYTIQHIIFIYYLPPDFYRSG